MLIRTFRVGCIRPPAFWLLFVASLLVACDRLQTKSEDSLASLGVAKSSFEKKARCAEAGWAYYERVRKDVERISGKRNSDLVNGPQFAYNLARDSCLCA